MYVKSGSLEIVTVPQRTKLLETAEGYVALAHNQQFGIKVGNHTYGLWAQLILRVHGKEVGVWMVPPLSSDVIEHPARDHSAFYFYRLGSSQAAAAGISQATQDVNGLVQAEYVWANPEPVAQQSGWPLIEHVPTYRRMSASGGEASRGMVKGISNYVSQTSSHESLTSSAPLAAASGSAYGAGGVGLAGHSDQTWRQYHGTFNPNELSRVVITLRLIEDRNAVPTDIHPIGTPPAGNIVPPPIY